MSPARSLFQCPFAEHLQREGWNSFDALHSSLWAQASDKTALVFQTQSRPAHRDPDVVGDREELPPCTVLRCPELADFTASRLTGVLVRDEYRIALLVAIARYTRSLLPVNFAVGTEFLDDLTTLEAHNPFLQQVDSPSPGGALCGMVVTGSAGIGKSLWLHYVLALRMLAGKPTVFQDSPDAYYISTSEGAFRIRSSALTRDAAAFLPEDTWCLVDSNAALVGVPPHIWRMRRFILQTAPPHPSHLEWRKEVQAIAPYYMAPWAPRELVYGHMLHPHRGLREQSVATHGLLFGAIARRAFDPLCYGPTYVQELLLAAHALSADALERAVHRTHALALADADARAGGLFVVVPRGTRAEYEVRFATESVRELVLTVHAERMGALGGEHCCAERPQSGGARDGVGGVS